MRRHPLCINNSFPKPSKLSFVSPSATHPEDCPAASDSGRVHPCHDPDAGCLPSPRCTPVRPCWGLQKTDCRSTPSLYPDPAASPPAWASCSHRCLRDPVYRSRRRPRTTPGLEKAKRADINIEAKMVEATADKTILFQPFSVTASVCASPLPHATSMTLCPFRAVTSMGVVWSSLEPKNKQERRHYRI